jgi:hypothetical protein
LSPPLPPLRKSTTARRWCAASESPPCCARAPPTPPTPPPSPPRPDGVRGAGRRRPLPTTWIITTARPAPRRAGVAFGSHSNVYSRGIGERGLQLVAFVLSRSPAHFPPPKAARAGTANTAHPPLSPLSRPTSRSPVATRAFPQRRRTAGRRSAGTRRSCASRKSSSEIFKPFFCLLCLFMCVLLCVCSCAALAARLPAKATNCRKKKCGHTAEAAHQEKAQVKFLNRFLFALFVYVCVALCLFLRCTCYLPAPSIMSAAVLASTSATSTSRSASFSSSSGVGCCAKRAARPLSNRARALQGATPVLASGA